MEILDALAFFYIYVGHNAFLANFPMYLQTWSKFL